MNTIKGDLIQLALEGNFDVIAHGCNCFSTQKSGIAKRMSEVFGTDQFNTETMREGHPYNKLGNIDWDIHLVSNDKPLTVINCYTQYMYGTKERQLDYNALSMCMKKINYLFRGKHIGLPYLIGCGLAGGSREVVMKILEKKLNDVRVTLVDFNGK